MIDASVGARIRAVCSLALLLAGGCFAPFPSPPSVSESKARPSLWEARTPAGELRFHLLGSVHLGTEQMLDLGPRVEAAFVEADELVLEADLGQLESAEVERATRRYGLVSPPETLADRVAPETLALVEAWARERGFPMVALRGLAPWLAAMTVALVEYERIGLDPELGVDKLFQERATRAGVPIVGLETLEFQFRTMAELEPRVQDLMLRDAVESRDEFASESRAMVDAWASGDEAALGSIVFEHAEDPGFAEFYASVVVDRNDRMADGLADLAQDGKHRFVVVGVAHMVGAEGLPALLAARGFRITEVQ